MNTKQQNKQNKLTATRTEYMAASYEGPIPDAVQLERYEKIMPGLADRFITMAEKQTSHRQTLEKSVVEANIRDSRLGLCFALIIAIFTIGGGVTAVLFGHDGAGAVISSVGLGGLTCNFIYGTRSSRLERENKNKNN